MASMTLSMMIRAKDMASSKLAKLSGGLRQTQRASQKLSGQTQQTSAAMGKLTGRASRARNELGRFTKQAHSAERGMGRLKKSLMGAFAAGAIAMGGGMMMGKLGGVAQTVTAYESSIDKVAAVANIRKGSNDYKMLDNQAKGLGTSTSFSASQVAQGQQYLAMAGFESKQIEAAMPGMLDLAKAGDTDLSTTSDIASNILSGFKLKAGDMGRVGDVLAATFTTSNTNLSMLGETMKYVAPIASKMGGSVEEVAAMAGMLGNVGIQGSQAGTSLRSLYTRMSAPPKIARDAMAQIGLSIKDANGEIKTMPTLLEEIAEKTAHLSEDQQMEIFKKIAGTEALAGMAELVSMAGTGELQNYINSVTGQDGRSNQVATQMSDNLGGDITALQSIKEGVQITIGELFMGDMRGAVQSTTLMLQNLNKWIKANPRLAKSIGMITGVLTGVAVVMGAIALFGPMLMAAFSPVMLPILAIAAGAGLIMANWDKLKNYFQFVLWDMGGSLKAGLNIVKSLFKGDWAGAKAGYGELKTQLKFLSESIWDGIVWGAPHIDDMLNLPQGTSLATIQAVWQPVSDFFTGFWSGLTDTFEPVSESFSSLWESLGGVKEAFGNLFDALFGDGEDSESMKNFGKFLGELTSGSLMLFATLLNLAAQGITALVKGATGFKEKVEPAFDWLTGQKRFNKWEDAHNQAQAVIKEHSQAVQDLAGSRKNALAALNEMTEAERKAATVQAKLGLSKAEGAKEEALKEVVGLALGANLTSKGSFNLMQSAKAGTLTPQQILDYIEVNKARPFAMSGKDEQKLFAVAEALLQLEEQITGFNTVLDNLTAFANGGGEKPKPKQPEPPKPQYIAQDVKGGYKENNETNIENNSETHVANTTNQSITVSVTVNEAEKMNPQAIGQVAAEAVAKQAQTMANDGSAL